MKKFVIFTAFIFLVSFPVIVKAYSEIKGVSLGEISGCDYYLIADSLGDYSLVEWYGGVTPYRNDIVVGELHSYGFKDLYNITRDSSTHVWIDDWMLSEDSVAEKLVDKCGWSRDIVNYFGSNQSSYSPEPHIVETPIYTPTCSSNSSLVNGQCICNVGYGAINGVCVTYNQACQTSYGTNSYGDKDNCYCNSGYVFNSDKICVPKLPDPVTRPVATPPPVLPVVELPPSVIDFEVDESDIDKLSEPFIAILNSPATFRKCPSTNCGVIRYYAEGVSLSVLGEYAKDSWYQVEGTMDNGSKKIGWIYKSLFGSIQKEKTSELDSETRASLVDAKPVSERSWYDKFLSFFSSLLN